MPFEIEREFARLYGIPCWDVHWDCDTGLRLNFGVPHLDVQEPLAKEPRPGKRDLLRIYRQVWVHGDWKLWVDGHWKLTLRDIPPVRGSSSIRQILPGLARLDGQQLTGLEIDQHSAFTRFVFDLGAVLEVRRLDRGGQDDLWELLTPEDRTLTVRGNGTYSFDRRYVQKRSWRPIERV